MIPRKSSAWPARLDVLQSLSGLLLALFVWAHMFFESSILLGEDAMYRVTKMFEGEPLFGKPYPLLVSAVGVAVFLMIAVHAVLALRKFPGSGREYGQLRRHMRALRLAMKWYPPSGAMSKRTRGRRKVAMWCILAFFISLGSASLLTYMYLGYQHADRVGERYQPGPARLPAEGG